MAEKTFTNTEVASLVLFFPLVFLRAFVLATLWGWFLVPLGLPVIGMGLAFGVALTVNYFSGIYLVHKVSEITKSNDDKKMELVKSVLTPFIFLSLGFIASFFV